MRFFRPTANGSFANSSRARTPRTSLKFPSATMCSGDSTAMRLIGLSGARCCTDAEASNSPIASTVVSSASGVCSASTRNPPPISTTSRTPRSRSILSRPTATRTNRIGLRPGGESRPTTSQQSLGSGRTTTILTCSSGGRRRTCPTAKPSSSALPGRSSMPKLNIGAGENPLRDWTNVDVGGHPGTLRMDATQLFPFLDGEFSHIFCEHALEHMPYLGALSCLRESFRTLTPGGRMRISVPHIDMLVRLYDNQDEPFERSYIDWHCKTLSPGAPIAVEAVWNNFY